MTARAGGQLEFPLALGVFWNWNRRHGLQPCGARNTRSRFALATSVIPSRTS